MKRNSYQLMALILCIAVGWTLGYLRLPHIEAHDAFWPGLLAGVAIAALTLVLIRIWNKQSLWLRLTGSDQSTGAPNNPGKSLRILWITIASLVVGGAALSGWIIYQQNQLIEKQALSQEKLIREQTELIESDRRLKLELLMSSLRDKLEDEFNDTGKNLGEATISRIAELSRSFVPEPDGKQDSVSHVRLSLERGRLLVMLVDLDMDPLTFTRIKKLTSFSGADLSGAKLAGIDLSGANLSRANLKDADLTGANLNGANLGRAILWGAQLNRAHLRNAKLKMADLRWAKLNGADLRAADLTGADLTSAQLRKSDLRGANFLWVKLDGAMLNDADMTGADLLRSSMKKANLTGANLTASHLRRADFSDAILSGVELIHAELDKNWLEKLTEWQTIDAHRIQKQYQIVPIDSARFNFARFRLESAEN